ncbi:hypothetical protein K440DRAFT_660737 [Wilcoxina mikolae CBS 423.85]|nr:hypothetical protein K440DRAFT_660737 [Wilcoxina mikolae CBS 423.85]
MSSPSTGNSSQNSRAVTIKIKDGLQLHFERQTRQPDQVVKYSYPLDNQHDGTDGSTRATCPPPEVLDVVTGGIPGFPGRIPDNTVQILEVPSVAAGRNVTVPSGARTIFEYTQKYKDLMVEMNKHKNPSSTDADPRPNNWDPLNPCVILNGKLEPEIFRLFISFPHVGFGTLQNGITDHTKTLAEYINSHCNPEDHVEREPRPLRDILFVDWTSFTIFGRVMVRSASNDHCSPVPFFPNQNRLDVLHVLVDMISTVLKYSSRSVRDHIRRKTLVLERKCQKIVEDSRYQPPIPEVADDATPEEKAPNKKLMDDRRKETEQRYIRGDSLNRELNVFITEMTTLRNIVRSQDEALQDLNDILENSDWDPEETGYNKNIIPLPPSLSQNGPENMPVILKSLRDVKEERAKFKEIIDQVLESGRTSQGLLLQLLHEKQATNTEHHALKQTTIARGHAIQARQQAQTMSLFTVVTTIFLPLTFINSYFTMEFSKSWPGSHRRFWALSGPITAVFMVLTFYIVMFKKHTSGEWNPKPGEDREAVKFLKTHAGFIWKLMSLITLIWHFIADLLRVIWNSLGSFFTFIVDGILALGYNCISGIKGLMRRISTYWQKNKSTTTLPTSRQSHANGSTQK